MRVLALSKYGRRAASPRHRFLAYQPYLAERDIHLEFSPLLDDDYLDKKLEGRGPSWTLIVASYLKRVVALTKAKRYDLLLVHCELFPYFPSWFEQALAQLNVPYVFDYDDAVFHMYDDHRLGVVRSLLSNKVRRIINGARAVMAGSEYLAEYARHHNDNVHVVPTVVDLERYRVKDWDNRDAKPFTIGWIGSPSTAPYLDLVKEPLSVFGKESGSRLLVIGADGPSIEGVELVSRPWSEETEVDLLLQCDVGIMPLPDEKWARGKCAFKLIQYMACGLPAIASPVGANVDVITSEVGMLASDTEQWLGALRRLHTGPELRRSLGLSGRARCDAHYSLASQTKAVAEIFRTAAYDTRQPTSS